MAWIFGDFELDPRAFELREKGVALHIEAQVLRLLQFFIENRDRMVSKEEIVEEIWEGRAISDSALSSRIKTARQLIGDDGKSQRLIKTIHGKGFRFVGEAQFRQNTTLVTETPDALSRTTEADDTAVRKPSIAVLPFRLIGVAGPYRMIAEALPSEIITDISRLRWLHVIARESSFLLREVGVKTAGSSLGARYVLTGSMEILGDRVKISVDINDARDGGIVWSDRYEDVVDAIHQIRRDIVTATLGAVELEIPAHEAREARLKSPDSLDAWTAYHVGLSCLFRSDRSRIELAKQMFQRALDIDPCFARAAAGLSSTHFLEAFVSRDQQAIDLARHFAELAMSEDGLDPFANMAQGRALWLNDDLEGSLSWLDRATRINPNYAQAIYSRGWTETLLGDGKSGMERANLSIRLSPLDPLGYAFVGVKAMACMLEGNAESAAALASKAALEPGAHALVQLLAVAFNDLAGNSQVAAHYARRALAMAPDCKRQDFLHSFPHRNERMQARIAAALAKYDF